MSGDAASDELTLVEHLLEAEGVGLEGEVGRVRAGLVRLVVGAVILGEGQVLAEGAVLRVEVRRGVLPLREVGLVGLLRLVRALLESADLVLDRVGVEGLAVAERRGLGALVEFDVEARVLRGGGVLLEDDRRLLVGVLLEDESVVELVERVAVVEGGLRARVLARVLVPRREPLLPAQQARVGVVERLRLLRDRRRLLGVRAQEVQVVHLLVLLRAPPGPRLLPEQSAAEELEAARRRLRGRRQALAQVRARRLAVQRRRRRELPQQARRQPPQHRAGVALHAGRQRLLVRERLQLRHGAARLQVELQVAELAQLLRRLVLLEPLLRRRLRALRLLRVAALRVVERALVLEARARLLERLREDAAVDAEVGLPRAARLREQVDELLDLLLVLLLLDRERALLLAQRVLDHLLLLLLDDEDLANLPLLHDPEPALRRTANDLVRELLVEK